MMKKPPVPEHPLATDPVAVLDAAHFTDKQFAIRISGDLIDCASDWSKGQKKIEEWLVRYSAARELGKSQLILRLAGIILKYQHDDEMALYELKKAIQKEL